jgi:hypothetical protein
MHHTHHLVSIIGHGEGCGHNGRGRRHQLPNGFLNPGQHRFGRTIRHFNGQHLPDFLYSLCESDIVRHSAILMMTGDAHYSLYRAHRQQEKVVPIHRLEIRASWCDAVHVLRGIKNG